MSLRGDFHSWECRQDGYWMNPSGEKTKNNNNNLWAAFRANADMCSLTWVNRCFPCSSYWFHILFESCGGNKYLHLACSDEDDDDETLDCCWSLLALKSGTHFRKFQLGWGLQILIRMATHAWFQPSVFPLILNWIHLKCIDGSPWCSSAQRRRTHQSALTRSAGNLIRIQITEWPLSLF